MPKRKDRTQSNTPSPQSRALPPNPDLIDFKVDGWKREAIGLCQFWDEDADYCRLKAEDLAHDAKLKAENLGHDVRLKAEEAKTKGNLSPSHRRSPLPLKTWYSIVDALFKNKVLIV
jgi:hypothetical protein